PLRCPFGPLWPFSGLVSQRFVLDPDALMVTLELAAQEPMPAWMGWHPWFRREVDGAGPLELDFRPGATDERDAHGTPTGRLIEPTPPPWDDCFRDLAADPRLRWPGGPELTILSNCVDWVGFDQRDEATCVHP